MPRLSLAHRNQILGLLEAGQSQTVVAGRYNVSRSTITRLVQRVNMTGRVEDRPRSGAPRVTSVRQDNFIRQRHLRDRFLTAQGTSNVVVGNHGRPIHRTTVGRRLRERGIYCRRPARCQALTLRHRLERQRWALNNRRRQWGRVVFSDESRFNLHHADGRVRIYRRRNERFERNCILEVYPYGGGGVMVWAAINSNFKSALVVCNGNLNARRYIDQILQPHVLPMFRQRQGFTFMHDNARPHTAILTREFLVQNNIPVLPWPACSPDCNPIEHMWDELGRRLRQRPHAPNNVDELTQALIEEWNTIPRRVYRNLCNSMPCRVQAVIHSHGGHTRY